MKTIKHLTGLCGEPHFNINTILTLLIIFYIIKIIYENRNKLDRNI